jgi:microcystin-dependent protein
MNITTILLILFLIVVILALNFVQYENMDNLSNEAVQNISGVYAKIAETATFNNINVTGNLSALNFKGIIVMWSGQISTIPQGWVLCDGSNGTPDLRSRFIVGASNGSISAPLTAKIVGAQGGEESHILTLGEMPMHNHSYYALVNNNGWWNNGYSNTGFSPKQWWPLKPNDVPTGNSGQNQPHNNMPPYYALAYIMKI